MTSIPITILSALAGAGLVILFLASARTRAMSQQDGQALELASSFHTAARKLGVNALQYERDVDGELRFVRGLLPAPALEVDVGTVQGKSCRELLTSWGASGLYKLYLRGLDEEFTFAFNLGQPGAAIVTHFPVERGRSAVVAWVHVPPDAPSASADDGGLRFDSNSPGNNGSGDV